MIRAADLYYMTCSKCAWFLDNPKSRDGSGYCGYDPPVVLLIDGAAVSVRPEVRDDHCCHHFEPIADEE